MVVLGCILVFFFVILVYWVVVVIVFVVFVGIELFIDEFVVLVMVYEDRVWCKDCFEIVVKGDSLWCYFRCNMVVLYVFNVYDV